LNLLFFASQYSFFVYCLIQDPTVPDAPNYLGLPFHSSDQGTALHQFPENGVFAVEGFERRAQRNEKLAAVGVGARISHAHLVGLIMKDRKILVVKCMSIDGLATGAVTLCKIAALNHEIIDDAVERGAFVVQRLSFRTNATLTCTQSSKILGRLWRRLIKEFKD
jgi:hypothetical protein